MYDVAKMFNLLKSVGRFRRKAIDFYRLYCLKNVGLGFAYKTELPPWKVIFYGTDTLSEVTLKALNDNRLLNNNCRVVQSLEVICVKSNSPVRRYAALNGLKIHTWPFDIPEGKYDVGIVVSFGHMIPSSSILACKYGIINAHPSLLPRWRGPAPIFYTILNGDQKTGVTIIQVSPNKFDVGNILMQEEYIIPERYTAIQLREDLSKIAADMVLKTLQKLPHYIEISYPQPTEGRTLSRKIKPEKCTINWAEDSAVCIDRKFRTFYGAFHFFTYWRGCVKVDILDIASPQEVKDAKIPDLVENPMSPGFCYFHKKRRILYVKCQDDWVGIKSFRVPKSGRITALEFYNGFYTKVDPKECYFV